MAAKTKPDLKQILADKVNNLTVQDEVIDDTASNTEITAIEQVQSTEILAIPDIVISLDEAKQRITALREFINEIMIPDVDYGNIPGVNKPSLFKSGAEKLCDIFGFAKRVEVTNRLEDFTAGTFFYEVKVSLINKRTGLLEADGVGCCNSKENKYKSQSGYSIQNTVLKMAKKRAFIDAVLSATRTSCVFTQDVEDLPLNGNPDSKSNNKPPQQPPKQNDTPQEPLVTNAKTKEILNVIKTSNLNMEFVKYQMQKRYNVSESKLLTCSQADDFIAYLMSYKVAQ